MGAHFNANVSMTCDVCEKMDDEVDVRFNSANELYLPDFYEFVGDQVLCQKCHLALMDKIGEFKKEFARLIGDPSFENISNYGLAIAIAKAK